MIWLNSLLIPSSLYIERTAGQLCHTLSTFLQIFYVTVIDGSLYVRTDLYAKFYKLETSTNSVLGIKPLISTVFLLVCSYRSLVQPRCCFTLFDCSQIESRNSTGSNIDEISTT